MTLVSGLQGGSEAEQNRGGESSAEGEGTDAPIRRSGEPWGSGTDFQQGAQYRASHCQPREGSEQRQQEAFGKQLANQAAAPGTDGDANGDFPLPGHAPSQKHAAQIAASNGQNRSEEHTSELQ